MRYSKNEAMLTPEENASLRTFKVCVIGCGGLGGYVIEMLARLGIGHLTVVDGDVFSVSNLNRQLLSQESNMGLSKALVAVERVRSINSEVQVIPVTEYMDETNADRILAGHDVIVDALDAIKPRFIAQARASSLGIPMVHGAIAGWHGQVTTIYPGDNTLNEIYPRNLEVLENPMGNPSFTPALVASIECAEVLKVLLNKEDCLRKKLLQIDLLNQTQEVIRFI